MTRSIRGKLFFVLALAGLLVAPAAFGDIYHVILLNGESYESIYPPEEASWDEDTILVHTETGQWVGVERSRIARVESETEVRGYGQRIDATTIYMGRTANSAPAPGQEGEQDPQLALLEAIYGQQQQQQNYTMEQFVEPGEMGGGIPVGFTQQVTPPLGGARPSSSNRAGPPQ